MDMEYPIETSSRRTSSSRGFILIKRFHPPECEVTDSGCATSENEILYDWPGSIPYLARVHKGDIVDAWACALVGAKVLRAPFASIGSSQLQRSTCEDLREWLSRNTDPVHSCCRAMLNPDPKLRMTVTDAAFRVRRLIVSYSSPNVEDSVKRSTTSFQRRHEKKEVRSHIRGTTHDGGRYTAQATNTTSFIEPQASS